MEIPPPSKNKNHVKKQKRKQDRQTNNPERIKNRAD